MRKAITIATEHGGKKSQTLFGVEVEIDAQLAAFRKLAPDFAAHPQFECVEIWESDGGIVKSRKFLTEEERKRRDDSLAKQQADFEEAQARKNDPPTPSKPKAEEKAPAAADKPQKKPKADEKP